jgi:hypothetical protein
MVNTACDDFKQLSWHVDDTIMTADGVRAHNRQHACTCKKPQPSFCKDE